MRFAWNNKNGTKHHFITNHPTSLCQKTCCFTYGFILGGRSTPPLKNPGPFRDQAPMTNQKCPKISMVQNRWVELGWFPKKTRGKSLQPEKSHLCEGLPFVHSYFSVRSTQKVGAIWNNYPVSFTPPKPTWNPKNCFFFHVSPWNQGNYFQVPAVRFLRKIIIFSKNFGSRSLGPQKSDKMPIQVASLMRPRWTLGWSP